ncbi:MAG: DUF2190 family protein [Phycisphaerales bacterium]
MTVTPNRLVRDEHHVSSQRFTNSTGSTIAAGTMKVVGGKLGRVVEDTVDGAVGVVHLRGVYALTKGTGVTYSVGQAVAVVISTQTVTNDLSNAAAGCYAGKVVQDAATGDTVVLVSLNETPAFVQFSRTCTAGENTANYVEVIMPNGANPTGYMHAMIRDSAGLDRGVNTYTFPATGTVRVANAAITATDIISFIAFL